MQESAERSPEPHPQDVSGDRNSDCDPRNRIYMNISWLPLFSLPNIDTPPALLCR
jgi:hypothetical protein